MAIVLPYIPETITVHLGPPNADAPNVTVNYVDYLKNVVAGEIYPTWDVSAIRANVLAINSYALNRVYTEYYRSRGYDFDITSSTAYDQSFSYGRSTFENTDRVVEELFDTYIRRQGFTEPLAAKFCNGTTVTCDGLSQWGSQNLAEQGYDSVQILRAYYGDNIELVTGAPIQGIEPSYPGSPLRQGSSGTEVLVMQLVLNRISQNYPSIPKVDPDGIFGPLTEEAVRTFQRIFGLTDDGIVGRATWYQIVRIYVAVKRLAELESEGLDYYLIAWSQPKRLHEGDQSVEVAHLQYMLDVMGRFDPAIPAVHTTGIYDTGTVDAVAAFQHAEGLPASGEVDAATWDALCQCYLDVEEVVFRDAALFPCPVVPTAKTVTEVQRQLRILCPVFPDLPCPRLTGRLDRETRRSLRNLQRIRDLPLTGMPDEATRSALAGFVDDLQYGAAARDAQFPGHDLHLGLQDPALTQDHRLNRRLTGVGQPVRMLQTALRAWEERTAGAPSVIPDGIYGNDTTQAVSRFQRKTGLPITGVADFATWNTLFHQMHNSSS